MAEIREARPEDLPRLIEMGAEFARSSVYRSEIEDVVASTRSILTFLSKSGGKVLVAEEEGKAVGMLGFLIYPHYYTGKPTAMEVIWYVDPAYRRSLTAVILLRAGERIAREMGAVKMQFTAPTADVGKMYEMLGYRPLEMGYQKDL
jgi:GNAT superfamily N-acetyltransferase